MAKSQRTALALAQSTRAKVDRMNRAHGSVFLAFARFNPDDDAPDPLEITSNGAWQALWRMLGQKEYQGGEPAERLMWEDVIRKFAAVAESWAQDGIGEDGKPVPDQRTGKPIRVRVWRLKRGGGSVELSKAEAELVRDRWAAFAKKGEAGVLVANAVDKLLRAA